MSSGPLYNLMLETVYHSPHNKDVDAYTIDRLPQGPLATYASLINDTDKHGPCGNQAGAVAPRRENRYKITLPPSVKTAYSHLTNNTYLDKYTLPGMLTWLDENGYDYVNLKYVVELDQGIWIRYTDGAGTDEFGARGIDAERAVPRSAAAAAPRVVRSQPKAAVGRRRR